MKLGIKQKNESTLFQYIVILAGIITLAISPWWNIDSMIIPKNILLSCFALELGNLLFIKSIAQNKDFNPLKKETNNKYTMISLYNLYRVAYICGIIYLFYCVSFVIKKLILIK